jgi:hypothetical protein
VARRVLVETGGARIKRRDVTISEREEQEIEHRCQRDAGVVLPFDSEGRLVKWRLELVMG